MPKTTKPLFVTEDGSVWITLTKGELCRVDVEHAGWLSQWNWCSNGTAADNRYVTRNTYAPRRQKHTLHRTLMSHVGFDIEGLTVDHINGDGFDNRVENLRVCCGRSNSKNRKKSSNNTSGFKGVTWHAKCKKWRAAIRVDGVDHSLGLHHTPELASRAYQAAAARYFGQFKREISYE